MGGTNSRGFPTTGLPTRLYGREQMRALDAHIIAEGVHGFTLMRRAGEAAFKLLRVLWPDARRVLVVCGGGNNGGDGYILAGLAASAGLGVSVLQVGQKLSGLAPDARDWATGLGVRVTPWDGSAGLSQNDVIIDALLGVGLSDQVRPEQQGAIEAINASGLPVLALDIPSGLCADTGIALGTAVCAAHTMTFIAIKLGLLTGQGPDYTGVLHCANLGATDTQLQAIGTAATRIDARMVAALLPASSPAMHKGQLGRVLVVGGHSGMGGAVLLAAEAAVRSGAGLVGALTDPVHVAAMLARCPEVMVEGVCSGQDMDSREGWADVLVTGPGLGTTAWSEQLLQKSCAFAKAASCVLDADALNLIADGRADWLEGIAGLVLTPHPGEAARLLHIDTTEVQRDRPAAVRALAKRYQAVVALKGAGTLVAAPDASALLLCSSGNQGMATGGMGDVLAGLIGGLMAQRMPPADAAAAGVWLHATAADMAADSGVRSLLPSDLMAPMRALLDDPVEATAAALP